VRRTKEAETNGEEELLGKLSSREGSLNHGFHSEKRKKKKTTLEIEPSLAMLHDMR